MDVLEGLNPAQAEAVQAIEGPVLVLAGPGSGKTRVLTHRIAYLIRVCGVQPFHILAVTFTNKAAQEMISRLSGLIGENTSRLTIGTFHAICARILRREAPHLGISSSFVIYDEDDQQRTITRILKELNLDTKLYRPSAVQSAISRAKNELITAKAYRPPTYWHEAVARVFERYEELKAESNALDFDDLLLRAEELFREHDEVRERYQKRYQHILVDEFQDTNKAQYELVRHLSAARRNVFVVGDEDQSIYSWRGADFRNVLRFRSDFPEARVLLLEQNYRSTRIILNAAQAVISQNKQRTAKKLWTKNEEGLPIRVFEAYDEHEEAEYIVGEITRLVSRGECRLADCAVMFRTNAQSRVLEDSFMRHGVSYKLIGTTRFYQRREIKDVLSYLRLLYNPDDEVSLSRVINTPPRGIGGKTVTQLANWAATLGLSSAAAIQHLARISRGELEGDASEIPFSERASKLLVAFAEMLTELDQARSTSTLSELLKLLLDKTGYLNFLRDGTEEGEDRANNVRELFSVTDSFNNVPLETALPTFLEEVALASDADEVDLQADNVTLLTLHLAKGLEYESVFIVGMEEGICPHSRSMDDPDAMEEERRLCYVGITRARKHLYLLRTFRRTLYGNSEVREASRFLEDIPGGLVEGSTIHSGAARGRAGAPSVPMGRERRRDLISQRRASIQETLVHRRASAEPERSGPGRRPAEWLSRAPALDEPQEERAAPQHATIQVSFHTGESVTHPVFGTGLVVSSQVVGDDEEVTVAFEGRGVKRLMASFAKLQKS
jgi:DNA helicase-2/ATP-dependent DNA helicase PcrA